MVARTPHVEQVPFFEAGVNELRSSLPFRISQDRDLPSVSILGRGEQ